MDWDQILNRIESTTLDWIFSAGIRLLIAVALIFLSFKTVNYIARKIEKSGSNGKLDKTLARTFAYIFRLGVKFIILICLIGFVGIDTSGFAALAVSLGAGIGLALNGALSNLAGGILIILTRPFRVDDFIEAQGETGTVEDIHVTATKIRTPDNKVIFIPNGPLSSGTIINYSIKPTRRVDFTFSIGYGDDFEYAKAVIMEICDKHELILKDPSPMARVSAHSSGSIDIVSRVWVNNIDYWTVKFDILEKVKNAFDEAGITIPYNQLDVHLIND